MREIDRKRYPRNDWFRRLAPPAVLLLLVWLWVCWPMIAGQTVVGFRDSGYLYYPLFEWIDAQLVAGELPLWNPYCNFGMSVVGDGTPSLFYPGKLIFCCRFLSYPARYGVYLSLHLLLAAVGTFWLARILKANRAGAILSGLSYAFGGTVLFQVTNVIYLVSAAWLPVALLCVWQMFRTGKMRWAVGAGIVCSLMILGGDPQMVYHVGLIAAASGAGRFYRRWRRRKQKSVLDRSHLLQFGLRELCLMMTLVGVTILLSVVQLLPSYEWAKLSERTNPELAVNVYAAIARTVSGSPNDQNLPSASVSLLGAPPRGTIIDHAYQFSQPPWSLVELFWPNSSGKIYPTHQRWADVLAGADRVWFPSLYIGLLTIWLAIGGFQLFGRGRYGWLTRIGLFFGIASFGWYGLVWSIFEWLPAEWRIEAIGPQVGGIYWAMVMLLPKYFAFRYPAKLFVVASLCLCLLAGMRLRSWRLGFSPTWVKFFVLITGAGLIGLGLGIHRDFFDRIPPDGLFGPFDAQRATGELLFSLVQVLIVLGSAVWISKSSAWRQRSGNGSLWAIVILTALDLVIANRWLLSEVPASAMQARSESMKSIDAELDNRKITGPVTLFRPRGAAFLPPTWARISSDSRIEELILWQRETFYPKQHLGRKVRLVGSFSSIWPEQYEQMLGEIASAAGRDFKRWYCDAEIVAAGAAITESAEARAVENELIELSWFKRQPGMFFLADDIVHPVPGFSQDGPDNQSSGATRPPVPSDSPDSKLELFEFGNNSVRLTASIDGRRWVVYNSLYDGNWIAEIQNLATGEVSEQALIELAHGYQGVLIEPGEYKLKFQYSPKRFWLGAVVSAVGWVVVALLGLAVCGWKILRWYHASTVN